MSTESTHRDDPYPDDDDTPTAPKPGWHQSWTARVGIVALLLLIAIVWHAGTFDHALYNIGLNAKPCARNGFGAVFCGQELEERRQLAEEAKQKIQNATQESEEAAARVRQQTEAAEAQLKRQSEEAERQYAPPSG